MTGLLSDLRAEAAQSEVERLLAAGDRPGAMGLLDDELVRLGRMGSAPDRLPLHLLAVDLLAGDANAERFHLTYAYVFALEIGDPVAIAGIENRLRALGGL